MKVKTDRQTQRDGKLRMVAVLGLLSALLWASCGNRSSAPQPVAPSPTAHAQHNPSPTPEAKVPPFHLDVASAKPFPKTLDPMQFGPTYIAEAYRIAKRIPDVLAQQPCYCYCDKFGHGSLLDCYATDHGAS
jgi:hypothetical protein